VFDTITSLTGDTLCNYCLDFDTCNAKYLINSITFRVPGGQVITLNQINSNYIGFNFPYCIDSPVYYSDCFGRPDQWELVNDLQSYLEVNNYKGSVDYSNLAACIPRGDQSPASCHMSRSEEHTSELQS